MSTRYNKQNEKEKFFLNKKHFVICKFNMQHLASRSYIESVETSKEKFIFLAENK